MVSSVSSSASYFASSVFAAQAASAKADQENADITAQNADGISALAAKGFHLTLRSFAGDYKEQVMSNVDSNGDHAISLDELSKQVRAGGGNDQDAGNLYAAMDMDKNGTVSAKEFEDSLPDPFSTEAFIQRRDALIAASQNNQSGPPVDILAMYSQQAQSVDTAKLLAHMGQELSAAANAAKA